MSIPQHLFPMSIHHKYILPLLGLACALSACSDDMPPTESAEAEQNVVLCLSLSPFANDPSPRSTLDGLAWEAGDGFRMRITCPYTTDHQNGELWSSGYHNLTFPADMGATVVFGPISSNQSQATTYIYTAQNTTGTRTFVVNDYRYKRPSNFFHADQSKLDQFKESDVLWAQGIRQTGAQEVHLNFEHKVARLDITLDDSRLTRQEWDEEVGALVDVADPLSANAILTLEGMPDIDGAELVVGDYYAPMTYEYEKFSYREKASCGYTLNGKVLGIEVIEENATSTIGNGTGRSSIAILTGGPTDLGETKYARIFGTVPNTGVYTCYCAGPKHYYLYVPPCVLPAKATFWVRDGERRYSATLDNQTFVEGNSYPVKLVLQP